MSQDQRGGRRMLNEQHLHTHLLTNKLHEGFAANYAQFFSTFSFKSGQTTRQKITQRIRKKTRNYPISFNVYICPMKFNLIKGQAGQQKAKQREKETQIKGEAGRMNSGSTNQSLLPKADLALSAQRHWKGMRRGGVRGGRVQMKLL